MRRQAITRLAALLIAVLVGPPCPAADAGRPNIVLVMADDLGWSDVGCFGGEIPTPAIDSLAREGLRLTQFYNNSVCGPTRASLLTGLYCQQVGHRGDHWNQPKDFRKCVTLGEVLQAAGYRTMMVGKWQGRDSALDRGFHRFFGPMCQGKISYFDEVVNNPYYLDRRRWPLPDDFYLTDALNEHAEQFLRDAAHRDAPFFLYVAHIAPHWPLHARESHVAEHRERYAQLGWSEARRQRLQRQQQTGLVPADWKLPSWPPGIAPWDHEPHRPWQTERMAVYAAQVTAIDRGVARLLQILDESGCRENTLVLFLSDNGAAPDGGLRPTGGGFGFTPAGANDRWRLDGEPILPGSGPDRPPGPRDTFAAYGLAWATVSNTPLRGTKLGAYEGGIRTPLIARWPAVIREGGRIDDQVGHVIDLMPTFCELAGAAYPEQLGERRPLPLEGASLGPIFRGLRRDPPRELCWSAPRHQAIRAGDWKAIRSKKGGPWQLYNLQTDGGETNDLAGLHPDRLQQLAARYEDWRERVGAK